MKPIFVAVAVFVGLSISSASGLKEAAKVMGRKTTSAIKHRNIKAFNAAVRPMATSDFVYTEEGSHMGYDEMMKHMKTGLGMLKSVSIADEKLLKIKESGMTGETKSSHHIKGTLVGPDGKVHTLEMFGTSKEGWVKKGGKWKLKSMTWLGQKQTIDGMPMPTMRPPSPTKPTAG